MKRFIIKIGLMFSYILYKNSCMVLRKDKGSYKIISEWIKKKKFKGTWFQKIGR